MKLWILLPAYNEEESIPRLFPKIKKELEGRMDYTIVVVDDGSTDDTPVVLRQYMKDYPLEVITHKINRGLGESERDAFEFVAEHASSGDVALRLDCDDTHEPEFFLSMVDKISQGYDVVIASRFCKGGGQKGVHGYRKWISDAASLYMKCFFNIPGVKDYSCGYRAYNAQVLKDAVSIFGNGFIQMKGVGFTSTLETIVKLNLLGASFTEVPFVLRYDQKASPSKMVSSITTLGYLIMTLLYWWPFGGWRSFYSKLSSVYSQSPKSAINEFSPLNKGRTTICRIGGC